MKGRGRGGRGGERGKEFGKITSTENNTSLQMEKYPLTVASIAKLYLDLGYPN